MRHPAITPGGRGRARGPARRQAPGRLRRAATTADLRQHVSAAAARVHGAVGVRRHGRAADHPQRQARPPRPARAAGRGRRAAAPRTPQEEILCGLFADVLGLATRRRRRQLLRPRRPLAAGHPADLRGSAAASASTCGIRDLFEAPTVAALAGRLDGAARRPARAGGGGQAGAAAAVVRAAAALVPRPGRGAERDLQRAGRVPRCAAPWTSTRWRRRSATSWRGTSRCARCSRPWTASRGRSSWRRRPPLA